MKVLKSRRPAGKADAKAAAAKAAAEKVYNARVKFERLMGRCDDLNDFCWGQFTLIAAPDAEDDGEFLPDELALVPDDQLYDGITQLEDAQEVIASMIDQLRDALDARGQ